MAMTDTGADRATDLPVLPAKRPRWIRQLLDRPEFLTDLAHGLGGPYHLLYPPRFASNVEAFRQTAQMAGVNARIYFAKKANKAACWVECCAERGVGVDVASAPEIRAALGHGVRGRDLVVTGPDKTAETLRLAAHQDCLLAVDSLGELDRVLRLATPVRFLLRCLPPDSDSRFGLSDGELDLALDRCCKADADVRLEGFSFHLSGYDARPRTDLAAKLIRLCQKAREMGLPATTVSIGGGFAVDYVEPADWQHFTDGDRPDWYHAGKTFDGFYPYHSPLAGAEMLGAVLQAVPTGEEASLAGLLREANVTLALEPGRALLDQAGCTVFTVQGIKDRGYGIITVDGTSMSLSEQWFASEFLPAPVLSPQGVDAPFAACVGGASCLESDMLTWRKAVFPRQPQRGDQIIYLNTAGYQMDSNESPFHELPLPPKVVLEPYDDRFRWRLERTSS